jgi:hypothetical protein
MSDNQVEVTADSEQEEKPKSRAGRPRIELDYEEIYRLAVIGCTKREISYVLDIHEDTLARRKEAIEAFERGAENSKVRLRRAMMQNAIDRMVPSVQIFLAKNMLGMSDQGNANTDGDGVLPWGD